MKSIAVLFALLVVIASITLLGQRPRAQAAGLTLWVTWNADTPQYFPGSGYCRDPLGNPWPCSLRAAIMEANAHPGITTAIHFAIGSGPQTIAPTSLLPLITSPVVIDGTTQPGWSGSPIIELDGEAAGAGAMGLQVQESAAGSVIMGLVINRFYSYGIILNGGLNLVMANFIGTDPSGTLPRPNTGGIWVSSSGNIIGGVGAAAGNLISGNAGDGVDIVNGVAGNVVRGNRIGTTAGGTAGLGNGMDGISLADAHDTVIGGPSEGMGNVISGNGWVGVRLSQGTSGSYVQGNIIGLDVSKSTPLANGTGGILVLANQGADPVNNLVGGDPDGASNVIASNSGPGVVVLQGTGNSILGNEIHDNSGLGIDLGGDGVTPDTPGGPHSGSNLLQNYPLVSRAYRDAASTTISFGLNSTPNSTFTVELFSSPSCDPSGYGEGRTFTYRSSSVVTGSGGDSPPYTITVPWVIAAGQFITASATDAGGNTSEFSRCQTVVPIQCAPGDTDCDGYLDSEDTSPNLYCPIMRADVDHNGKVNLLDLAQTALNFGQKILPAPAVHDQGPPAQFDYVINLLDLAKEALQYGKPVTECP